MIRISDIRWLASAAILLGITGCSKDPPVWPSERDAPASMPAGFPEIVGGAEVYVRSEIAAHLKTPLVSRYVLYPDGTFQLQYFNESLGFSQWKGRFRYSAIGYGFSFETGTPTDWIATAAFVKNGIDVRYSDQMMAARLLAGSLLSGHAGLGPPNPTFGSNRRFLSLTSRLRQSARRS